MKPWEHLFSGLPWLGGALFQATLLAGLGLLAWLALRRGGPALRGAVLLAALLGVLLVPLLGAWSPVWLPLPEWALWPTRPAAVDEPTIAERPAAEPVPPAVTAFPVKVRLAPVPLGDQTLPPAGDAVGEVVVVSYTAPEETVPLPAPAPPPARPWPVSEVVAAVWLIGALASLAWALFRLAALQRCRRRTRPLTAEEHAACLESLARHHGGPVHVELRESPTLASPLTVGLWRPAILLPASWRGWSAEQRTLILAHELAHVRRRDFLAGLLAELTVCLFWFHPLVRWLAGKLRLEQEYAADAWAVAAAGNSTDYVCCLARLALELDQNQASLAPALWRRRPEILRRIDMLRHSSSTHAPRLGKGSGAAVAVLALAICVTVAGMGHLRSIAADPKSTEDAPAAGDRPRADVHGDPLPDGAKARLGTLRWRHGDAITFVAFLPDGKAVLTAGQDGTLRLWDRETGKEIRRFERPKKEAEPPRKPDRKLKPAQFDLMMLGDGGRGDSAFALSSDGKVLAAGAVQGIIQLWDVETGKDLRSIKAPPAGLAALQFAPDGKTLAGRSRDRTTYLWETATGKEIRQLKVPQRQRDNFTVAIGGGSGDSISLAFSPDGKTLATTEVEYKQQNSVYSVRLWETTTGKELRQIKTDQNGISAVAFTPDGKVLVYRSGSTTHLCAADSDKEIRKIDTKVNGVGTLAFAPDGKTLALKGRDQVVRLWQTDTGEEVRQLGTAAAPPDDNQLFIFGFGDPEQRDLAFSSDGKTLAAGGSPALRLWDLGTGKELSQRDGHSAAVKLAVLSADGKTLVSWGADHVVRRWDAVAGKERSRFAAPAGTTTAVFSADGRTVALANRDGTIRLHETATGKELHRLKSAAAVLAFAPDGKTLASRGGSSNAIQLHDVVTGKELRQIALPAAGDNADGNVIVFKSGGGLAGSGGLGLVFSPDGKLVASQGVNNSNQRNARAALHLWDTATGKEVRKIELPLGRSVVSFSFSPDGRVLAMENADQTIALVEVASGKERGQLGKPVVAEQPNNGMAYMIAFAGAGPLGGSAPAAPVTLAFAPDGRTLAARGPNSTVRVWDVAAGRPLGEWKGHAGGIETLAFAPDGRTLLSGGSDTTTLIWDATSLRREPGRPAAELKPQEVPALWEDLAGDDAGKAQRSMLALAAAPKQVVPFLREQLRPTPPTDIKKLDQWIADLESEKLAVRNQAMEELTKLGERAVPALQKLVAEPPTLETRRRAEQVLDRLTGVTLTSEQLRLVRAVEVLEQLGTAEARQLLEALAGGAAGALPTREAQAALRRLARQASSRN